MGVEAGNEFFLFKDSPFLSPLPPHLESPLDNSSEQLQAKGLLLPEAGAVSG